MDPRIRRFRQQVEVLNRGREPRGRRYPGDLRRMALAIATDHRRRGESLESVARALGLTSTLLCRWRRASGGPLRVLRPVIAMEVPEAAVAPAGTLVLITRGGDRLEGLGVAEAIQVLRALS